MEKGCVLFVCLFNRVLAQHAATHSTFFAGYSLGKVLSDFIMDNATCCIAVCCTCIRLKKTSA